MADLEKAIELSKGKGKPACQAYTQRGLIRRFEGNDDEARKDFQQAAELGSQFAKAQVFCQYFSFLMTSVALLLS